jgi:pimeloyl-ACP methyl ester carboxylesterase
VASRFLYTIEAKPGSRKEISRAAEGAYLKKITQPALVVNGDNDVIIYTVNSCILQRNLPNAQLILYPDANHGSQYQYPELFVAHATLFLNGTSQLLSAIRRPAICSLEEVEVA